MTIELFLAAILVVLGWADAVSTYLFLKKAKDYGYPRWSEEETSPIYRYFVRKYGLVHGISVTALVIPPVMILMAHLVSVYFSWIVNLDTALGLGYGIFYGIIFISVHRNYYVYYLCPAGKYNEKIMGKPRRPEKHKPC